MREKIMVRMMGTVITLDIGATNAKELIDNSVQLLRMYEKRFSANDPNSELMAVNQAAGIRSIQVHPDLFKLIKLGKYHSCAADSHLNIAIGPLVKLWHIGFKDARVPSPEDIKKRLILINPQKIELDEKTQSVYLQIPGMEIDLGALAKGFIADLIIDYLKEQQAESAMLNLGGNVVVLGNAPTRDDGFYRIGIQDPLSSRNTYMTIIPVHNQSVVTSGVYERKLKIGDKTYHHIFDSKTGYPITSDISSLTIVSHHSVDGEIWTSRLFGKGILEILEVVGQLKNVECLIIDNQNKLYQSEIDIN
ncbi:FAD:protein FMN transferase [Vagococcus vulneris]|uniref:FAD:protein FMN transferase n=1 Tax=Vagococcus vulneris TaxID=1977869 RepID=A0A430A1P8_9ENTE|nr:FAD:protein FMN transferase [Vagococcus vulneris]RSU00287.1 thiamine biosynthesis protein ApbE [Vagococcus vulneris]